MPIRIAEPPLPIMPALTGVLETALYVADLARARDFYRRVLGFELLLEDHRLCALAVAGRQVLLLFRAGTATRPNETPGGTIPPHDGQGQLHLALAVPAEALSQWEQRLADEGVALESRVHAARGGTSLYFRDPDGHLLELATPGIWRVY